MQSLIIEKKTRPKFTRQVQTNTPSYVYTPIGSIFAPGCMMYFNKRQKQSEKFFVSLDFSLAFLLDVSIMVSDGITRFKSGSLFKEHGRGQCIRKDHCALLCKRHQPRPLFYESR